MQKLLAQVSDISENKTEKHFSNISEDQSTRFAGGAAAMSGGAIFQDVQTGRQQLNSNNLPVDSESVTDDDKSNSYLTLLNKQTESKNVEDPASTEALVPQNISNNLSHPTPLTSLPSTVSLNEDEFHDSMITDSQASIIQVPVKETVEINNYMPEISELLPVRVKQITKDF
ncbi:unnamed protein product, partial [Lymnaea stagnalis]